MGAALGKLGGLSESLSEVAASLRGGGSEGAGGAGAGAGAGSSARPRRAFGEGVAHAKQRQAIAEAETGRLQQVVAHKAFAADPLGALAAHLQAVAPPVPERKRERTKVSGSARRKERKFQDMLRRERDAMDM